MKKITALALVLIICAVLFCGCKAYVPQKKNFDSMVGTWKLDCVYADTKAVAFDQEMLYIAKDGTAQREVTKIVTPEIENPDGSKTPAVTESKAEKYTVMYTSEGNVNFSGTTDSVAYEFSVDIPAGDLHLYTDIEGVYYHYIYRLSENKTAQ